MRLATVHFIIAMIASASTDRLARKMELLSRRREEQRLLMELLHQATGKKRFAFTADHLRRLAIKGKELSAKQRKACSATFSGTVIFSVSLERSAAK